MLLEKYHRANSSSGVVLIELAIVIPLLILLIFAIYEVGSNLSHVARINQVAYSAALRGAGIAENGGSSEVATIAMELYGASLKAPMRVTPIATPNYDTGSRLVSLYFNEGSANFANPFFLDLPVALSVTLPMLVNPEASEVTDKYMSPSPLYCPNGLPCMGPPQNPPPLQSCTAACCWEHGAVVPCCFANGARIPCPAGGE